MGERIDQFRENLPVKLTGIDNNMQVFGVALVVLAFKLRARLDKHQHGSAAQTVT